MGKPAKKRKKPKIQFPEPVTVAWMGSLTRYLDCLRMCQRSGRRIGVVDHKGQPAVAYVLDGKQWRFRHGVVLGPWRMDTGDLWRELWG